MTKSKVIAKNLRIAWAIAEKDIKIYYAKAPSLMFGVLFPVSLFLSFVIGRNMPVDKAIPVLVAQTLLFASSSIGPITIPLERRIRTFERFLSAPVSLKIVLFGKMIAGFIFGMVVSTIPILMSIGFFNSQLTNPISLALGMILSALGFAAMGIMFAFLPGQGPGQVMMPLNFVRIPLLFISGVFIPVKELPPIGQIISMFSPLTHSIELVRYGLGGEIFFSPILNIIILFFYLIVFMFLGIRFHVMSQRKE
jgi:ABC-2 type transport system permease protein